MSLELITLKELLRDPQYRAFFTKVPKLPEHYTPENKPWKLMILKPGEHAWRSKQMGTYQEAFRALKKLMPDIENAAINCRPLTFMPPTRTVRIKGKFETVRGKQKPVIKTIIWKPQITADMADHNWCGHCRRPSIFTMATTSAKRSASGFVSAPGGPAIRCVICGASDRIIDLRNPANHQQWDPNRPKIY